MGLLAQGVAAATGREPPPAWVTASLCLLLIGVGVFVAADFRGIPRQWHEWMGGRADRGFVRSFAHQRLIGIGLAAGGVWGLAAVALHFLSSQ
ncbi:hypothetical protein [Streptomyces sp. NPDC088246]|uniref:hypothetical protein n=1 Tax=Streptomyces sp. NPDC088246 TaxID=3365842 RepID=UPI00382AF558